ncbi:hypothetical protein EI545_17345 [Tabrizicola piscis]|uniref:Uncharacterized protein n=1 Tax=Tabrizicola piscis TaxID=2494374 RepID=A0A3S8UA25_9RHOB|nr:hypothetical protein EI545_17345 [Tabrizicola piscis]
MNAVFAHAGIHQPRHLTLGNAVQHGGIGLRRFGTEIAVLGGQVAEILGDGLHGVEGIVETLQRTAERAIGHRQDFALTGHDMTAFRLLAPQH